MARIVRYDACVLASALGPFELEAVHPDEFIIRNWDLSPDSILGAARSQRAGLTRSPESGAEYLATLEKSDFRDVIAISAALE